jgi:hypothetical protein
MTLFLFYFTPVGLIVWISLAMWHMRRQHQIREKSPVLYYVLIVQDAIGLAADVAGNYTWASVILLNCPRPPLFRDKYTHKLRWTTKEITISQHMKRINDAWVDIAEPTLHDRYTHAISSAVCRKLNKLEKDGKRHC